MNVRVMSTQSGAIETEFIISEAGAGSTPEEAQANSEERLAAKLKDQLVARVR